MPQSHEVAIGLVEVSRAHVRIETSTSCKVQLPTRHKGARVSGSSGSSVTYPASAYPLSRLAPAHYLMFR